MAFSESPSTQDHTDALSAAMFINAPSATTTQPAMTSLLTSEVEVGILKSEGLSPEPCALALNPLTILHTTPPGSSALSVRRVD
jgi:hypothetical protein